MTDIKELINLLQMQKLSDTIFLGQNYMSPWKRVFGGQVLAQALSAASQTVENERYAHSLHAYFLLAGDCNVPIVYEVEKIRDGGSFSTRRVVAKQNGIAIFFLSASFQKTNQPGYNHAIEMPIVPPPHELKSDEEIIKQYEKWIPNSLAELITSRPFEFKVAEGFDLFDTSKKPPYKNVWFKAKQSVATTQAINRQLLTYVSDYNLLLTATLPHTEGPYPVGVFMASLDHGIWFHRDFDVNDWLLYAIDSPSASNSRGFSRGNIFTKDGLLVASVTQEGVIRPKTES